VSNSLQKDSIALLRLAARQGFEVRPGGKHYRIVTPSGETLTASRSPSAPSTLENLRHKLRRHGLDV
jgi:hypothetical protein